MGNLLRIPTAQRPMAGTEGFKYHASDGEESVKFTLSSPSLYGSGGIGSDGYKEVTVIRK